MRGSIDGIAFVKRKIIRVILLVALACCAIWVVQVTDPRAIIRSVLQRISDLGPWAPPLFILAYAISCLIFFPGVILTLGAGILFGVLKGTFLVSVGASIGAACAFLISRHFAREWVERRFGSNPTFRAIDGAVAREGWKILGLIRLSPVFPFIPTNFFFGLTNISLVRFFFVTWVGIIPVTMMWAYLGSLIGSLAELGTEPVVTGKTKWFLTSVGLVVTIIVTAFVTRIGRRALAGKLPDDKNTASPSDPRIS